MDRGHYAKECPINHDYRDFQTRKGQDFTLDENTTCPLQMSEKPHIVDSYLYRPSANVYSGKPSSYPVKSYSSGQSAGGTYRQEKAPEKRGVEKKYTPSPPEQPQRSAGGGAGGVPGGGPPDKGPPDGGHDDDDSDGIDDDDEDDDDDDSDQKDDEYKQLKITPGQIPVKI